MLTATYKLDLVPGGIPLVIPVSQYDVNSRVFSLELTSSGGAVSIPSTASAAIRGTKPDGNGFDYAASGITISGDTVTVSITLTAQMTAVAGRIPCEIYLYTGTPPTTANPDGVNYVQLATANFILQVKPAALDKDTLKSDSEIRQLVDVIDRTDELLDAAADIETAYADYSNKAVFYAEAQTLTDAQKIQARANAAAAEDVIEEPGRNLFYLTAGAHTYAELTFTLNDDGSFNVTSGGSTVSSTRLVPIMGCTSQTNYRVPAGTYVFGYTKSNETAAANFTLRWYSASNTGGSEVTPGTPFTLASASALVLRFGSGYAYGGTYHCELEAGTALHRYVPAKKSAVDTVARADSEYAAAGVDRLDGAVAQVADDLAQVESGLAGKVQISQGAAQAGKALVVGEDGNVTTGEAGIPDAVKTALLNLLSHVAYVDGNGQSYYDALSEALGSDWYNTWRWSLSDGQFESYPYTGGFTGSTGYLNINANKESNIRRAMLTKRGQRPYRLNQTDELSDFYAIPVPANASKVDITVLPATLQTAITIVRQTVEGEVGDYARVLDTGWQSNIGTQYFSASPNKVLDIKCRADANDSTFTTSTEPSEIIVEFGIDDFYDRWRWTLQSGNVSVNQRTSGIDNTNHRLIISSGNEANRRFISVERGVVPFYDSKAAALSTLYPIPVPAAAKKVTVTVTPSTIQGQACVVKRTDDSYASYSWMEWSNFPLVNNFTPSEKLELMIMLRADSSNSNFTSATEPTALTVDFE